jgi:hypothetical protein
MLRKLSTETFTDVLLAAEGAPMSSLRWYSTNVLLMEFIFMVF